MKKILLIADCLEKFNINGDTTYLMLLTAKDMQMELNYCDSTGIYSLNEQAYAYVSGLEILHGVEQIYTSQNWFRLSPETEPVNLTEFDAVIVRNNPPFDMEYYYLTQVLELAEKSGVKVVNNAPALRNFNEKLAILNFPDIITPTLVTKNKQALNEFINSYKICVAKPVDMMAGRGVFQISSQDPNQDVILETLSNYYTQTIMLQRFIPEVVEGDKRIFIIDGKIVDHCLYRIPQQGQIRGNLAVGGRGEVHKLSQQDYEIAGKVALWLNEHKIIFAGIDVIGSYLTEINITSPTGAHQILKDTGINVAELVLNTI